MNELMKCVIKNDLVGIAAQLARGVNPDTADSTGMTPLHYAAIDNKLNVAAVLLKNNANVNAQDKAGNSALHFASQERLLDMVILLLNNGALVDIEDSHGNTALWKAVFNSRGEGAIIKALIANGADQHHKNSHGKTPVDLAKTIANYNVAQFF